MGASDPDFEVVSSFEGKNHNTNDDSDFQSELEEEINAELDLACDPNYPPLAKWTRDHPKTQVIGEAPEGLLTRSQIKAKQTALFSQGPEGMFINQEAYTKTLLAKFGMMGDSNVKVPMAFGTKLTPSLEKPVVDMTLYRKMIGSLTYLTTIRPDVMFSVRYYARFQANPCEPHMVDVKNILRYLKRTSSLGLWYPAKSGFFIQVFSDADLGGCGLDRKITTGGCQFLDGKLLGWQSKKQTYVSLSTAEADYIAATSCISQVIWIQSQLRDYGLNMKKIPIYCDSESAIRIYHNPVQHSKTKHIAL
ncbi:uncharacterized mitochondrial protein AtMg00810-like [Lactuca sativa]|uniref:uncharacterized mitochondrial protein AtMg00810-like n=1 Tax=Lactuca sativa TaxID=4236 RepID=UPI0022B0396A|nr:uncharacterized mitochondrial protein AtMg00810-like [Lactuca sativa]